MENWVKKCGHPKNYNMSKADVKFYRKKLATSIPDRLYMYMVLQENVFENFLKLKLEMPAYDAQWLSCHSGRVELSCSDDRNSTVKYFKHMSISYAQLMLDLKNLTPFGRCKLHEECENDIDCMQPDDFLKLFFMYGTLQALQDYYWLVIKNEDVTWDLNHVAFKDGGDHTLSLLIHSPFVLEVGKAESRETKSQTRASSTKQIEKKCEDGTSVWSALMPKTNKVGKTVALPSDNRKVKADFLLIDGKLVEVDLLPIDD